MTSIDRVAIVGSGSVGRALGATLGRAGVGVVYGVRREVADLPAPSAPVLDAIQGADAVILAVPAAAAGEVARTVEPAGDRILIDCTNPIRWDAGPVWDPPAEGSVSAMLAALHPALRVVKAFNHFGAEIQANPTLAGGPATAFVASDDGEARAAVLDLARRMGFRAEDVGSLRNAATLENLAILWIHRATVGGAGRDFSFEPVSRVG